MLTDLVPVPRSLFDKTAHWFDRAKAALLGELPCSKGCSHCCVGVFPVTRLDRQEIQLGLQVLSSDDRQIIVERATAQVKLIEGDVPKLTQNPFIDSWQDRDTDVLVEQYRELPCPALRADGSCGVYPFRPLTCRSMGIPTEVDGLVYGACAVQTSVPIVRLSRLLREEEDRLVSEEAEQLACLREQRRTEGEELLLPYAFAPEIVGEPTAGVA